MSNTNILAHAQKVPYTSDNRLIMSAFGYMVRYDPQRQERPFAAIKPSGRIGDYQTGDEAFQAVLEAQQQAIYGSLLNGSSVTVKKHKELMDTCNVLNDTLHNVSNERDALLATLREIWQMVGNGHDWKRASEVSRAVETALNDAHGGLLPGCDTITIGGNGE